MTEAATVDGGGCYRLTLRWRRGTPRRSRHYLLLTAYYLLLLLTKPYCLLRTTHHVAHAKVAPAYGDELAAAEHLGGAVVDPLVVRVPLPIL